MFPKIGQFGRRKSGAVSLDTDSQDMSIGGSRVPTEAQYAQMRKDYQQQRAHEANIQNVRDYYARPRTPDVDNFATPRYVVGTRKYSSPTPGKAPVSWL